MLLPKKLTLTNITNKQRVRVRGMSIDQGSVEAIWQCTEKRTTVWSAGWQVAPAIISEEFKKIPYKL